MVYLSIESYADGSAERVNISAVDPYSDDDDSAKWTVELVVDPDHKLTTSAQANILQNILQRAGVTVVRS